MELKSGEIYRGEMYEAEDNWNVQLSNVQATGRDGKVRSSRQAAGPGRQWEREHERQQ